MRRLRHRDVQPVVLSHFVARLASGLIINVHAARFNRPLHFRTTEIRTQVKQHILIEAHPFGLDHYDEVERFA